MHAAEQERPDVAEARRQWKDDQARLDPAKLIFVDETGELFGSGIKTEVFPTADQYTMQGDAFARAVLDNTEVPVPLEDAIRNMAVIEAIFRSAETNNWEKPDQAA